MNEIVQVYIDFVQAIVPFLIVFGFGNMALGAILRAAFGGRLIIK